MVLHFETSDCSVVLVASPGVNIQLLKIDVVKFSYFWAEKLLVLSVVQKLVGY